MLPVIVPHQALEACTVDDLGVVAPKDLGPGCELVRVLVPKFGLHLRLKATQIECLKQEMYRGGVLRTRPHTASTGAWRSGSTAHGDLDHITQVWCLDLLPLGLSQGLPKAEPLWAYSAGGHAGISSATPDLAKERDVIARPCEQRGRPGIRLLHMHVQRLTRLRGNRAAVLHPGARLRVQGCGCKAEGARQRARGSGRKGAGAQ